MSLAQLFNFAWVTSPGAWIGLVTLIALEIVLGLDNIVFITILSGKLPPAQQPRARKVGMALAVVPRIVLLLLLPLVLSLEQPLFYLPFPDPSGKGPLGISVQDLIVISGGLFLLYKATYEIHHKLEGVPATTEGDTERGATSYGGVLLQIVVLNIVFSLDSIVTAIGMVPKEQVMVMVIAVLASTLVMAASINTVGAFVEKHPTVKMLALSFLLLIGLTLLIEGLHAHVPKGYVYFAMAFSVFVEILNLRSTARKKIDPLNLHKPHV